MSTGEGEDVGQPLAPLPAWEAVDVLASGWRVSEARWYGEDAVEALASAAPSATHVRTVWAGLGVDEAELSCVDAAGGFRWRVWTERSRLRVGARLALTPADDGAAHQAAAADARWTVGSLGRAGLDPAPRGEQEALRTLFVALVEGWPRLRLRLYDDAGELWGGLDPAPEAAATWALRRWDSRVLLRLGVERADPSGVAWWAAPSSGLAPGLEVAAVEAAPLLVVLLGEGPWGGS